MDEVIGTLGSLLASEADARIVLIALIVLGVVMVVVIAMIAVLVKLTSAIKSQSKKEVQAETVETEYRKKVDDTKNDIVELSKLITRLTEVVQISNDETRKEFNETKSELSDIRKCIANTANGSCAYGQSVHSAIESLKTDILDPLSGKVEILLESDRETIKNFITDNYHKWMKLGYIDMYKLKALDELFIRYRKENGNTFVEGMMKELHLLETVVVTQNCLTRRMKREVYEGNILRSDQYEDDDLDIVIESGDLDG